MFMLAYVARKDNRKANKILSECFTGSMQGIGSPMEGLPTF
jgi:hypothetical protein